MAGTPAIFTTNLPAIYTTNLPAIFTTNLPAIFTINLPTAASAAAIRHHITDHRQPTATQYSILFHPAWINDHDAISMMLPKYLFLIGTMH
jgi:hypothetical protein